MFFYYLVPISGQAIWYIAYATILYYKQPHRHFYIRLMRFKGLRIKKL